MKTEKTQTAAVAVRSQMQVKLQSIDEALAKLKVDSESPFKTNGEFKYNPYSNYGTVNIHRLGDISSLLNIYAYIKSKHDMYEEAATKFDLKVYPAFTWMNYSLKDWEHDISVRLTLVTQHDRVKKLRDAKAKLQSFMTEEDRLAIVLKELEDIV